jgi:hypothetical protein
MAKGEESKEGCEEDREEEKEVTSVESLQLTDIVVIA